MSRARRACAPLAAALALAAGAVAAQPSPVDAAREHFDRGVAFMLHARWADALAELEAARGERATAPLLYNLGLAHRALNHDRAAHAAFTEFLAVAGASLPEARAREVRGYLAELEARLVRVELRLAPPAAAATIDGAAVTGPGPVVLAPGQHLVRVTAPGHVAAALPLDLAAGAYAPVAVRLAPLALAPAAPSASVALRRPAAPRASARVGVGWLWGGAAAGVVAVAALVVGAVLLAQPSAAPYTGALGYVSGAP